MRARRMSVRSHPASGPGAAAFRVLRRLRPDRADESPGEPGARPGRERLAVRPALGGSGGRFITNKGKPVRQYEPFFSATPKFGIERWGVSNVLFYDPACE